MENITLGTVTRNGKLTLEVEVLVDNQLVGKHKFNKDWCSHSFTEEDHIDTEDMLFIFQETKVLVDRLRKEL